VLSCPGSSIKAAFHGDRQIIHLQLGRREFSGVPAYNPCLDPHDLVLSKYAAGREKDKRFNRAAIREGYVAGPVLLERLNSMPLEPSLREIIRDRITHDLSS